MLSRQLRDELERGEEEGDRAPDGWWITTAIDLLRQIRATQAGAIDVAAELCADAIGGGGLVHLFGTGHSRIPVEEMFPRYGSYPGFHPIVELSTTFHTQIVGANGQRQAMFIERVEGLAEVILSNFDLAPPDVMMVFSASGRSANPIEMAIGARRRGLPVIAVTSVTQSDALAATHSSGTRLYDHADVVIDLCTPAADALVDLDGLATPVGPGSSVAAVAIVNEIKVRVARRLVERGAMPPVLTSASVVGQDESNRLFEAAYGEHARRLAAVLTGGRSGDVAVDGVGGEHLLDDHRRRADDAAQVAGTCLDDPEVGRGQR